MVHQAKTKFNYRNQLRGLTFTSYVLLLVYGPWLYYLLETKDRGEILLHMH